MISVLECLSERILEDIFSLCVHQYSEVRILAQEVFHKIIGKEFLSFIYITMNNRGEGGIDSSIISELESSVIFCLYFQAKNIKELYQPLHDYHDAKFLLSGFYGYLKPCRNS